MALKLFRAVWFLSVLVVLANLLYVYASWPEFVIVQEDERVAVDKEWMFYISMGGIVLVNALVYLFKMMFAENEDLRAWFHGLMITINLFFIIALHALNVYNSNEAFNHNLASLYLTGSLALILLWAALWPLYLLIQKIFVKQPV